MAFLRNIIIISCFFALTGCGLGFNGTPSTPEENQKYFKLGKPYQIEGRWYYPKYDPTYEETGVASWYGPDFHNKPTANGETFDKYSMTAAHKTLPLPSIVKVTNLENGKSVVVRVNDRGPFVNGRIIDVSKRAAEKLGMMGHGTARVRVKFLPEETAALFPSAIHPMELAAAQKSYKSVPVTKVSSRSLIPDAEAKEIKTASTPAKKEIKLASLSKKNIPANIQPVVYIQAASYSAKDKAKQAAKKLQKFGKTTIVPIRKKNKDYFRVRIGPLKNEKTANKIVDTISMKGFGDAFVIVD